MKSFNEFVNENMTETYTMYSGISLDAWEKIWKNKNFKDRETNVTDNKSLAFGFSYNYNTGEYDDIAVEISNIPLDAFVAYRNDEYEDDDDFNSMNDLSNEKKKDLIDNNSMFLVSLFSYKNQITTKLIKR